MEEVVSRFPHIAEQIFEELDNDYFIQCKIISQSWKNFMEENKFSYIRLIKKSTDCSKKAIEKIFPKINLEDTIRLASDVNKVYDELRKENDLSLTLFHMAAKHGYLSVCQLIIDGIESKHPNDPTAVCARRQNPLHFAAKNGHFSICQLILTNHEEYYETGSQVYQDIVEFDIDDNTPIHMAAQNGYLSICELLINWIETTYPDDIEYANAENADGNTPLHLAASYGHLAVCQFLVEKVEHTNGENVFGATPLLCAVENYHSAIFHLIFESTVDKRNINIGDNHGQTPLHSAAANDLLSVCQKLIEVVDEVNPENDNGNTPLHLAAQKGHLQICQLIVNNINYKNPKNFNGETPIQLASDYGHSTIVKILQAGLSKKIKLG